MRALWDTFRGLLRLHQVGFHGEVVVTFEGGLVTFTRTTSKRKPAELSGDDGELIAFLATAQKLSDEDAPLLEPTGR